jgi:hypothetical protein
VDQASGLSIPALVVGLSLLSLLAFGGAFLLPKWLDRQRGVLVDLDDPADDEFPEARR